MLAIRNGVVVTCDAAGRRWDRADIVIKNDKIVAVGPEAAVPFITAKAPVTNLDASQRVVIPGLINAHLHSTESFEQGAYEEAPLEVWLNLCYPPLAPAVKLPERTHYLRAMMCCAQSIRSGVTTIQDDLINASGDAAVINGTMSAYRDAGLKASVAVTFGDRPYLEGYPGLRKIVPESLCTELDNLQILPIEAQIANFHAIRQQWHDAADGRLRLILGPRGPQKCTPRLLDKMAELSAEHRMPVHMHVLETRTQALAAKALYNKTFIEVLREFRLLNELLTLNHAIWLTAEDILSLGEAGCSTTHNPLSNMKLGSGVSPLRRLVEAGVNVALGTDGLSTSDTANQMEVVRATSMLHKLVDHDPAKWIGAENALRMATINGARSCKRDKEIGSIEVGKQADVVLLDRRNYGFVPLNDPVRQIAYSVTSEAVTTVIADGKFLMKDRKITVFDEDTMLDEIIEEAERYRRDVLPNRATAALRLAPYLQAMYSRSMTAPIPPTVNPNFCS
jgi:5-methylthioadenosine/S-adenosylhomocysteine deaminase